MQTGMLNYWLLLLKLRKQVRLPGAGLVDLRKEPIWFRQIVRLTYTMNFIEGELAEIGLRGDGDTDLDLFVNYSLLIQNW